MIHHHHHHSSKTFLKPKKTSYPSPSLDLSMFAVKSITCKHTHGLVLILKHFVLTWPPSSSKFYLECEEIIFPNRFFLE
jgi:hypothetical protein